MSRSSIPALTLVKAGAGAGKTHHIQQQLTEWIKKGKVRADKILAVTFTKAAANEMRERIRLNLLQQGMVDVANQAQQASISTIHGFGFSLLESFAYEKGLSPTPRQLTEAEENQLIRHALNDVEAISPLLADLERFGYTHTYTNNEYVDSAAKLKQDILTVINKLRALGKGVPEQKRSTVAEGKMLLSRAEKVVTRAYGRTADHKTLNTALWSAIKALRKRYPDPTTLSEEWASNEPSRKFVAAIYRATKALIEKDWSLWVSLQTINAPRIVSARKRHADAHLAEAIWAAADDLYRHPGPLDDALIQIHSLLDSAMQTLEQYQQLKTDAGLVDFGDMVHLAERLMANSTWLDEACARYDCLIIDEFQDTNPLQFALLRHFQRAGLPTLIVGDLKQSIMGFQGSDSRLFASMLKEAKASQCEELRSNWRSTAPLMGFINKLGTTLYGDDYQKLTPRSGLESKLSPVQILRFEKDEWGKKSSQYKLGIHSEGMVAMVNHLLTLINSKAKVTDRHTGKQRPIQPSDIAVLAPRNDLLTRFAEALRKAGLQAQISEPGFIYSPAVRWVVSALQYLNNRNDEYALLDMLTSELFNYHGTDRLEKLLSEYLKTKRFEDPLLDALHKIDKHLTLKPVKAQIITIIEGMGLFGRLATHPDGPQQRANLIKLIGQADAFENIQYESLRAMGLHGKNASTFLAWLEESSTQNDEQPATEPDTSNAVVLTTWHGAKGLEWPVVLVIGAHEAKSPSLPAIDISYPDRNIDKMLKESFVRILPSFKDKSTEEKITDLLVDGFIETQQNLCYVAMTRAREQVIISWMDDYADHSPLFYISKALSTYSTKERSEHIKSRTVPASDAAITTTMKEPVKQACVLMVHEQAMAPAIRHTISPSLSAHEAHAEALTFEEVRYGPGLSLEHLKEVLPANEIGTAIHRYYQVYLRRPELMEKCLAMEPKIFTTGSQLTLLTDHLQSFRTWLTTGTLNAQAWQCELPVLSRNEMGQTISGDIDLLVETPTGLWIVDHKTDTKTDNNKHTAQLMAYARYLSMDKPVVGIAINWVRHGVVVLNKLDQV